MLLVRHFHEYFISSICDMNKEEWIDRISLFQHQLMALSGACECITVLTSEHCQEPWNRIQL